MCDAKGTMYTWKLLYTVILSFIFDGGMFYAFFVQFHLMNAGVLLKIGAGPVKLVFWPFL